MFPDQLQAFLQKLPKSSAHRPVRRFAVPVLLCLVALLACVQGSRAPKVPPRGTLSLKGEGGLSTFDGPFGVVFAGPQGSAGAAAEVSVVFNRPMRPLDVAGSEAPFPAQIAPAVPGRWQWVGTSAGIFTPDRSDQNGVLKHRLPGATDYKVTVPAGTSSLAGDTLDEPFSFQFSTPRPRIVGISPSSGSDGLEPGTTFDVRFNYGVTNEALARHVALVAADKPVELSFERPDPDNQKRVVLKPKTPLPINSPIKLAFKSSLTTVEGPLPLGTDDVREFRTYGPLQVRDFSCYKDTPNNGCDTSSGLSFELTNPVKFSELKRLITVSPAVTLRWPSWMEDDELVEYVNLDGNYKPGARYSVRIRGGAQGLRDKYGQALASDHSESVVMGDRWPVARLGLYGRVFEPGARSAIPVASINVQKLEIATAPIAEKDLLTYASVDYHDGRPPEFSAIETMASANKRVVASAAGKNQVTTHQVDPKRALGGKKRGPVAIGLRYVQRPGTKQARSVTDTAVVQITDLGISGKFSRRGSIVWVTNLSDAKPLPDAQVILRRRDQPDVIKTTDADGLVQIDAKEYRPDSSKDDDDAVVIVKKDDDWAFRYVDSSLDGWRFGIPYHGIGSDRPFGMVFSERGIYRPGDAVKLKGIVRGDAEAGTSTPVGQPVHIEVQSPDGDEIFRGTKTLSPYGTFDLSVPIPRTGRLGTHFVDVTVGGSQYNFSDLSTTFEVAEYRPVEFEVGVESAKPSFIRGDDASWTVHGDYLFGAPMNGADARVTVSRSRTYFTPKGLDGFTTDDEDYIYDLDNDAPYRSLVSSKRTKLSEGGTHNVAAKLDMPGQRGAERITTEAEITDLSRQTVASSTTAIVHPGTFYVGLKTESWFADVGDKLTPEVLAARPGGQTVVGQSVKVDLIRRKWVNAQQSTGGGGTHYVSKAVDEIVTSCNTRTAQKAVGCPLVPPTAGYYLLRATAKDERGNPLASSRGVYVTGSGGGGWADSDALRVELVADKKSYEIGDTARILVKSPFKSAEALVTVERGGIKTTKRMTLTGGMPTIPIKVTPDLRPNAYVSVLLIRGRSKSAPAGIDKPDVGAPAFRMGYAEVPVNPEARRLTVAVRPSKKDFRPGESADVALEVKDRDGKPVSAEVTLYAVDEGVLSLIGYETPDPIPVFGAPRDLEVQSMESRIALARTFNPFGDVGVDKGLDGGGGGEGGSGASVRKNFKTSAYYNPSIITDASGKASVRFALPEQLTTFRIMAVVAAQDDRFGYGAERITTSKPLMARPALPRFLRAGDELTASVIISAKGNGAPAASSEGGEVEVRLDASGIELIGESVKQTNVAPGTSQEVRFAARATKVGDATFAFSVRGPLGRDSVEVKRAVQVPMSLEAVALYGETTSQAAEQLGDLKEIRSDVGGLEVELASTALVGLDGGAEQLIEYPYGCTEQLSSRLVPMLPLRDMAKTFGFPLPENTDRVVEGTVAKLLEHQRYDGGFGFWPDSPDANAWVTTYALWSLGEANKRGVKLPKGALERGRTYLIKKLNEGTLSSEWLATSPFVLYVLAEQGEPDPGRVDSLFEMRDKLPVFSRALLLHAMVLSKVDKERIAELATELEQTIVLDGPIARVAENRGDEYAVLMHSETRTTALVLRSLLAANPKHPMAVRLAKGLLADRDGGSWRTTQETAWSLLALADYQVAQESEKTDFDATLFLGESELYRAAFRSKSVNAQRTTIPAIKLTSASGSPLAFDLQGSGKLFYEARLRYAKKKLPTDSIDRGFFVQKKLRKVTPEALSQALGVSPDASQTTYIGGDLVMADVLVVSPKPRRFVVIESPLPAGFEGVDSRLATSASDLDVDEASDYDADDVATGTAFQNVWFRREVRDDRVLFFADYMPAGMFRFRYLARATSLGRFVVPPTKAEEMYTPEVFGRTGAERVTVKPN